MVPAAVSERQEKPVLSTRMALSHIYNAGYKEGRHLSAENVTEIKRGTIAKHFWPDYSEVAKAIDEALVKLERRGNIHLPDDYKRARVGWDTLAEVRDNITVHLDWVLAHNGKQSLLEALTGQSCAQWRLSIHLRQTDVFRLDVALHALLHVRRRLEWHWSNVRALESQDFEL